jgi:hypothetical protein
MGPKLLFILGIIVAHGALAASWLHQDAPKPRASIASCVRAPDTLPNFEPPRELLAMAEIPMVDLRVLQP